MLMLSSAVKPLKPFGQRAVFSKARRSASRAFGSSATVAWSGVCVFMVNLLHYDRGQSNAQLYLWRFPPLNRKKPGAGRDRRHFQIAADSDIVRQFFSFRPLTERRIAQRDLAKGLAWNDGPRLTLKKKR